MLQGVLEHTCSSRKKHKFVTYMYKVYLKGFFMLEEELQGTVEVVEYFL